MREYTRLDVGTTSVSAMLDMPDCSPAFVYVLAHGAGAGMTHPFLEQFAAECVSRNVAVLRYNFPYMEVKKARVDTPAVAFAAVGAAVSCARERWPGVPIVAGGKSFGGRMTSGAHAERALHGVVGLAFLGFPLHPPGKPNIERAAHLEAVQVPMLFCQGSKDEFADPILLATVLQRLGTRATAHIVEGGDHSFKVPKSRGVSAADVHAQLVDALVQWHHTIPTST